jgi:hypothetical protein
MNVEIGTEAPIFLFWEYLFQIFGILSLQCGVSPIDSIIHRRDFKSRFSDIFGFAVVYSMEGSLFFLQMSHY